MGNKTQEDIIQELKRLRQENKVLKKLLRGKPDNLQTKTLEERKEDSLISYFPGHDYRSEYLQSLPFLMWSKDKNGRYISVNDEFARSFGHESSFFAGLTDFDFLPRVFADRFHSEDLKIIRTGEPKIAEELFPFKDGISWHETVRIPIVENNEIRGVAAFSKDISERKQKEKALKESEEKFRELAENTTDSFILRSGKKILYVNPAFEQVYGYSRKDIFSNPDLYKEWIHPADKERIFCLL